LIQPKRMNVIDSKKLSMILFGIML